MRKTMLALATAALCGTAGAEQTNCSQDEAPLHVPSPVWQDQVIYMLFIDRFQDGDPGNNDQGYGEYDPASGAHFSGGDMQGIISRLDYLKSLGISAIWISPPVANQWWSTPYQATGWHGYWAVDFREVDKHFGTLRDYQRLSRELHCRGMYLIQDAVANHTANFFTYDGGYDPNDTARNFRLLEPDSHQPAPTQPPFHMIDRRDPEHAAANIYHWTPTLRDFADPYQETQHMFGQLADLNSENPLVIAALKETYKRWMSEVGVDAFRLDAVSLVRHEFWNRFLHDDDGIYAHARRLGKNHFLTFGEAVAASDPFADKGERKLKGYIGSPAKPYINSMLGYPLYYEIIRVLGRGEPTSQLRHRLELFMDIFDDPFNIPTFIDNHDTPRFLATGSVAAFEQALILLFTVPGIPIMYQGTEQALRETRQAMFRGGYHNPTGSFDQDSRPYRLVRELAALRRGSRILTRGDIDIVASESAGAGVFAYRRTLDGRAVAVVMNTASHSVLAHRVPLGVGAGETLDAAFALNGAGGLTADEAGLLTAVLPPRSVFVSEVFAPQDPPERADAPPVITISGPSSGATFGDDFRLSGRSLGPGELRLVRNGNMDATRAFRADADGRWSIDIPVADLGRHEHFLQVYDAEADLLSERFSYTADVREPTTDLERADVAGDDAGPSGRYVKPLQPQSRSQKDILGVRVRTAGANLELTLKMAEISTNWLPPNGFDNVTFSIFFDVDGDAGTGALPRLNATMPDELAWDLAHVASGWASYMYGASDAAANAQGDRLSISPRIETDKADGMVTLRYAGEPLGVDDWMGAHIYVTTWDHGPEGEYLEIGEAATDWTFGGGPPDSPKVLDDVLLGVFNE